MLHEDTDRDDLAIELDETAANDDTDDDDDEIDEVEDDYDEDDEAEAENGPANEPDDLDRQGRRRAASLIARRTT
jgi:hypothetical protein